MTNTDKEDILIDSFSKMTEGACRLVAISKQKQINITQLVYVDSDGNDKVIEIFDFYFHIWKSNDTLDSIASSLMGSAEYSTILSYFNNIQNENDIDSGTKIKIPILTENNKNNKIYAIPENQDNYGIDIAISENGDFDFLGGDLATVGNTKNLAQAIALRLTTASDKRIRLTSYGIKTNIGDANAIENYLIGSIEETVKADPRIKSIEEITFKGHGDKLYCKIIYTDINGNSGNFSGDI